MIEIYIKGLVIATEASAAKTLCALLESVLIDLDLYPIIGSCVIEEANNVNAVAKTLQKMWNEPYEVMYTLVMLEANIYTYAREIPFNVDFFKNYAELFPNTHFIFFLGKHSIIPTELGIDLGNNVYQSFLLKPYLFTDVKKVVRDIFQISEPYPLNRYKNMKIYNLTKKDKKRIKRNFPQVKTTIAILNHL